MGVVKTIVPGISFGLSEETGFEAADWITACPFSISFVALIEQNEG